MKCTKCNHSLPDDSEFCQYCGSRIEKIVVTPVVETREEPAPQLPDFSRMTSDEVLNAILQVHARNTVETMTANSHAQPNNEGDADFGLVPEKPIFTQALKSVEGEREYLEKLYTVKGEKIKYHRRGSTSVNGINGMIDIYDTYLPSGQLYKTIYINMYGAKTSVSAPKGFVLQWNENPKKIDVSAARSTKAEHARLNLIASVLTITLSAIAILAIVVAMNVQDIKRNIYEVTDPTILYLLLIGIYLVCIMLFLVLKKKDFPIAQHLFSFIPSLCTIITIIEGSLFSSSYISGSLSHLYINSGPLSIANTTWVLISFAILVINLVPLKVNTQSKWRASIRYREYCYKRVENMKGYQEKGIITEAEYMKTKQEILKNIKR